jgi:carboxymethylenebutenolidase
MKTTLAAVLVLSALPAVAQMTPPSDEWAKARLTKSSRHQEWVQLKNGDRTVSAFVVYPEVKTKATAVVVIHEIFGLSNWAQSLTDQLAEAGYIAIAPDLLSGMGPNGGRTDSFDPSKVTEAVSKLPADQITGDLNAAADYIKKVPAANGKLVVAGFCFGGTQTFRFATNRPDVVAALVFYGSGPTKPEDIARIKAKVYGFYAENDNRIDATIPDTEKLMKDAGKPYEPVIYKGAGHGFMRAGEQPEPTPANKQAREDAWVRLKEILKKL